MYVHVCVPVCVVCVVSPVSTCSCKAVVQRVGSGYLGSWSHLVCASVWKGKSY